MPFSDLNGALRLIERIDEIVAFVRTWPERAFEVRDFTWADLDKFDNIDAKVGGLMQAIGLVFPQPPRVSEHSVAHGFTGLVIFSGHKDGMCADNPGDWERRIVAVKTAAMEILDVAGSQSNTESPKSSERPKWSGRIWTVEDYYAAKRLYEENGAVFNPALEHGSPAAYHVMAQAQYQAAREQEKEDGPVRADGTKLFPKGVPDDPDLVDLAVRLNSAKGTDQKATEIARAHTNETVGNDEKAKKLLARLRTMKNRGQYNP